MLSVHNIMQRAGVRWLAILGGSQPPPLTIANSDDTYELSKSWVLPLSDEEDEPCVAIAPEYVADPAPRQAMDAKKWAELNREGDAGVG